MQNPRIVIQKLLRRWGADILLQRRIYTSGTGIYALNRYQDFDATPSTYTFGDFDDGFFSGLRPPLVSLPGYNAENTFTPATDESYYSNKLERWTVLYTMASRKIQIPNMEQDRPEGESRNAPLIMYFTADAAPTEGDRVYIHDERFIDSQTVWRIRYAHPETGFTGEIDYYIAGLIRESRNAQEISG